MQINKANSEIMSDCCLRGFRWNGNPVGTESKIGDNKAYITGDNKDAAVLMVTDLYGWRFKNIRLLADHYAEEAGVTVFVPDLSADPTFRLQYVVAY